MPLSAAAMAAAAEPEGWWIQWYQELWEEFQQEREMGLVRPPKRGRLGREEQVEQQAQVRAEALRLQAIELAQVRAELLEARTGKGSEAFLAARQQQDQQENDELRSTVTKLRARVTELEESAKKWRLRSLALKQENEELRIEAAKLCTPVTGKGSGDEEGKDEEEGGEEAEEEEEQERPEEGPWERIESRHEPGVFYWYNPLTGVSQPMDPSEMNPNAAGEEMRQEDSRTMGGVGGGSSTSSSSTTAPSSSTRQYGQHACTYHVFYWEGQKW